jgi:hypothetical protein
VTDADDTKTLAGARARSLADSATNGASVRTLCDALALEALELMGGVLRDPKEKDSARRAAARDIMYVWSRLPPAMPGSGAPPGKLTPEEETAAMAEALRNPQFRALLERLGAKLPPIVEVAP